MSPTASRAWPTSVPRSSPSTWSSDEWHNASSGLTGATLEHAPAVCQTCVWWQSRDRPDGATRTAGSRRPRTTGAHGARSTATTTDGCSARSSTARRSSSRAPPSFPPARRRDDAVLVTCVYVVSSATPWVEQSLFLAAIGEARDKGAKALEAFAYRYPEGESTYERFLVHRTVFPRDFLADFGFRAVRTQGRVELARLELGGLVPVAEGSGRACCASSRRRSRRRPCRSAPSTDAATDALSRRR